MVNGHLCEYTKDGTMHVYYKTKYSNPLRVGHPGMTYDKEKWEVHDYKLLRVEFCCKQMAENFGHPIPTMGRFNRTCPIDFGELHDFDYTLNHSNRVTVCDVSVYPGNVVYDTISIDFCPFCGGKITCTEEEKVKMATESRLENVIKHTTKEVPFE